MKQRIVSITLVLSIVLCCFGATAHAADTTEFSHESVGSSWIDFAARIFAGGRGTEDDPYLIESAEQLALLAKYVNNQNRAYTNAHYLLTSDIDLGEHQWTPIGAIAGNEDSYLGFKGVFDGNGHTISNMTITEYDSSRYQFGLFGWNLGTIKNVILKDAIIRFESTLEGWQASNGMGSGISVGGICGETGSGSLVENCLVDNIEIDVNAVMSLTVGGAIGSLNYASAKYISTSGTINVKVDRALWVGGCIGQISNDTTIEQACFSGSISTESNGDVGDGVHGYVHYVGGFTGSAGRGNGDITIKNCYSEADIFSKTEEGNQDVGGFAGAVGIIHDFASYENLVTKSKITTDRAGTVSSEQGFWQGEVGFGEQSYCDEWQYKNCVVITDDEIVVTNYSSTDSRDTQNYSLSESSVREIMIDELGFSDEIWRISDDGKIALKMTKPVNPFQDVKDEDFFYEPVLWAYENGITSGLSATGFGPGAVCNRAQVVTFLWRAAGCPEPTGTENPFVDVTESDFYHKAVLWAVEKGITTGTDETHFSPNESCNRAQVVTFLYRAMQSPAFSTTDCPFTDVEPGQWYEPAVLWAVEKGITNGMSADSFGVNTVCNRAQVVTFLHRTYVN